MAAGRVHLLDIVHLGNGSIGVSLIGISNKTKAPASTSIPVLDNYLIPSALVS